MNMGKYKDFKIKKGVLERYLGSSREVVIPDIVTEISSYAFYVCTTLTDITIPCSFINIRSNAFAYCANIRNVYYAGSVKGWCGINFEDGSATPMNSVCNFHALADNINLYMMSKLLIPDSVITINDYAFQSFGCLTSVAISDSVVNIGRHAFSHCVNLTSVIISDSVVNIDWGAFGGCEHITNLVLGRGLSYIDETAFAAHNNKTNVYYNGRIEDWCRLNSGNIGSKPTYYIDNLYILDANNNYFLLTELTVPDSVEILYPHIFGAIACLRKLIIPDSVVKIEHSIKMHVCISTNALKN